MHRCIICRFEVELDDVAGEWGTDAAICLRCYHHLARTALQMPRVLRRQLETCMEPSPQS